MSDILTAIQAANPSECTFAFASIQEFQSFTDKYSFSDYPVNVVFPFDIAGTSDNNTGVRKAVVTIDGFIFTRVSEDTNNYRTLTMEDVIDPLRELAIDFIQNLSASSIVNKNITTISDSIRPVYQELPDHFFGVRYKVQLPIIQNVC
ncbi:MAG: hypothetical protein RI909_1884 [Bacteroidota bacterium]|jgi:hypothetical protein